MICPLFRAAVIMHYGNIPSPNLPQDLDEMVAEKCEKCIGEKCAWWSTEWKDCMPVNIPTPFEVSRVE